MNKFLNNRGDTIVEVLIAIAIISATMGGAYVLATRSLKGARVAQERTEAQKLAESQIERLKFNARSYGSGFDADFRISNYCFGKSGTHPKVANASFPAIEGECTYDLYRVNITYSSHATVPSFGTFAVTVEWDSLGSLVTENVTINYQL